MTPEEREARCRTLAEWLEPSPVPYRYNDSHNFPGKLSERGAWVFDGFWDTHYSSCATHQGLACDCFGEGPHANRKRPVDFYMNEVASALLLEALASLPRFCCVEVAKDNEGGVWHCSLRLACGDDLGEDKHLPLQPNYAWPDRKTAVAEAALRHAVGVKSE